MVLKSEKEKVKTLLAETIRLLCKNGLNFKTEFSVEALVGITLDKDEEFFLSIKETVKSDIRPQKLDTPKTQKESHHNGNREIKGEPGQHSSCRKRASETVTNVAGSSELPSLSLGDMQEGEQSFWSSVTGSDGEGAGGEGGTSHPSKRTKVEASEDDSNSNVIEIKGEPGSESEEEDGGGGEASQVDQSGADMSGPYTYATPVTSAHEMIGSGMAQVWDQLPPFSSMPGPSGMAAGMSQDGQQQFPSRHFLVTNNNRPIINDAQLVHSLHQLTTSHPKAVRRRTSSGRFKCTHCLYSCNSSTSMRRHMKIHSQSPEFSCDLCEKKYHERWRLLRHQKNIHFKAPNLDLNVSQQQHQQHQQQQQQQQNPNNSASGAKLVLDSSWSVLATGSNLVMEPAKQEYDDQQRDPEEDGGQRENQSAGD